MPRACGGTQSTVCQPSCMKFMMPRCLLCLKVTVRMPGKLQRRMLRTSCRGHLFVLKCPLGERGVGRAELVGGEIANQPRARHLGRRVCSFSLTARCALEAGPGLSPRWLSAARSPWRAFLSSFTPLSRTFVCMRLFAFPLFEAQSTSIRLIGP